MINASAVVHFEATALQEHRRAIQCMAVVLGLVLAGGATVQVIGDRDHHQGELASAAALQRQALEAQHVRDLGEVQKLKAEVAAARGQARLAAELVPHAMLEANQVQTTGVLAAPKLNVASGVVAGRRVEVRQTTGVLAIAKLDVAKDVTSEVAAGDHVDVQPVTVQHVDIHPLDVQPSVAAGSTAGTRNPAEAGAGREVAPAGRLVVAAATEREPATPQALRHEYTRRVDPKVEPVRHTVTATVVTPRETPRSMPRTVAPAASTTAALPDAADLPRIEAVSQAQAQVDTLTPQAVKMRNGLLVAVGSVFPSGEKLLGVDPARHQIVTDRRTIVLMP